MSNKYDGSNLTQNDMNKVRKTTEKNKKRIIIDGQAQAIYVVDKNGKKNKYLDFKTGKIILKVSKKLDSAPLPLKNRIIWPPIHLNKRIVKKLSKHL